MSDIQPLLDRLRAMYVPASLQLQLQPRLTREDAEQIIAQLTAALATVEKCKAAGFIDERGEVRTNAIDEATDTEAARWQTAIDEYVVAIYPDRDGSGTDSGDPLDLTHTEIRGALGVLSECMNDLLKAPMGVVPKSCDRFYRNGVFDIYWHTRPTPEAAAAAKGGGE